MSTYQERRRPGTWYRTPEYRKRMSDMRKGILVRPRRTFEEEADRFWSKVEKSESCWLWKPNKTLTRYGCFYLNNGQMTAHRFSYAVTKGEVPEGLELDHLCSIKACVNPDHLEAVTHTVNVRRAKITSRQKICKRGHEFTEDNTNWTKNPWGTPQRHCRACANLRARMKTKKWRLQNGLE